MTIRSSERACAICSKQRSVRDYRGIGRAGREEKALESHPNLAILDLAMPRMDGLTAAGKISQAYQDMPILMYTMHFSRHIEVEALKHGVRKVISKTDSAGLVSAFANFWQPSRKL